MPGGFPKDFGAVVFFSDDNFAVFDYFDILLGEDNCAVLIADLSD